MFDDRPARLAAGLESIGLLQLLVACIQHLVLAEIGVEIRDACDIAVVGIAQLWRVDNAFQVTGDAPGATKLFQCIFYRSDEIFPAGFGDLFGRADGGPAVCEQQVECRRDVFGTHFGVAGQSGKI